MASEQPNALRAVQQSGQDFFASGMVQAAHRSSKARDLRVGNRPRSPNSALRFGRLRMEPFLQPGRDLRRGSKRQQADGFGSLGGRLFVSPAACTIALTSGPLPVTRRCESAAPGHTCLMQPANQRCQRRRAG